MTSVVKADRPGILESFVLGPSFFVVLRPLSVLWSLVLGPSLVMCSSVVLGTTTRDQGGTGTKDQGGTRDQGPSTKDEGLSRLRGDVLPQHRTAIDAERHVGAAVAKQRSGLRPFGHALSGDVQVGFGKPVRRLALRIAGIDGRAALKQQVDDRFAAHVGRAVQGALPGGVRGVRIGAAIEQVRD